MKQINSQIITNNINYSGIYLIINLQNNKFYVGSAKKLNSRKMQHLNLLRKNKHANTYLQNSYNKNGEENFTFVVIEKVEDENKLTEREQYWIDTLDATNKEIAYNICPTANSMLGYKHSEDTINKLKKYEGELSPFYGKHHTEETKNKISIKNSNPSDETREKHRQAALNQSPEARKKIAEAKFKSVIQLTLEGEFVRKWNSIKEACDTLCFQQSSISTCCANKNNVKQHKGFIWIWEHNYKDFDINNYKRPYKNNKGKITLQYDLDGNFIKEWLNAKTASRELGLEYISITECCTGKIKKSQGFIWKYAS